MRARAEQSVTVVLELNGEDTHELLNLLTKIASWNDGAVLSPSEIGLARRYAAAIQEAEDSVRF